MHRMKRCKHNWMIETLEEMPNKDNRLGIPYEIEITLYCRKCNKFADGILEIKDD